MSTSLFEDPAPATTPDPAPGGAPPREPPPRPSRARGGLALLLVLAAALGGGGVAAVLAIAGALDGAGSGTITTVASASPGRAGNSGGLNAGAVYASAAPGVVDITAKGISAGDVPTPFGPQQSQTTATGTGFVISKDGTIVTAAHVVDSASSITVTLQDGTTRSAKLLGKDDATDVAVLKVDASGLRLHPLTLGSSASLRVGDALAAIGDPFGYRRSLSTGVVSGLDRTISAPNGFTVAHAIQTDATLNPGNSGGPVLNAAGEVIGIADQIATNGSSSSNSGVGFAVPIDLAKSELTRLVAGATVRHAYLGVATGGADTTGVGVQSVTSGGPADQAGVRPGDVITTLDGTAVKGGNDLVAASAAHQPGDRVALTVRRGSRELTINVTLGRQPTAASTS